MRVKVAKLDSPILKAHGVKIGMIGEVLPNDYDSKYDYKISFQSITSPLYFYKDEIEEIEEVRDENTNTR